MYIMCSDQIHPWAFPSSSFSTLHIFLSTLCVSFKNLLNPFNASYMCMKVRPYIKDI